MNTDRNDRFELTTGGMDFMYGDRFRSSAFFVVSLTMRVSPTILENALNETLGRFPQFDVRIAPEGDSLGFIPADSPLQVLEEASSIPACYEDVAWGGRVICVSYLYKTIFFRYHRSVADEHGIIAFIKSVLFRYMELAGYPVANDGTVKHISGTPFKAENDDPMEKVEDYPASRPVWYMDAKAVRPTIDHSEGEDVAQVRIPLAKLSRSLEPLTNIPVTYLAPLFSHSVYESMQEGINPGEYVVASIQINLRPYFPTASLRPFHTPVFLAYNRILGDYPYNTVLMSQKKLLEAQLKTDALAYSAQRKIADIEKACRGSLEQKKSAFTALNDKMSAKSTYSVCRIGNLILPDQLQRYVTEFYPVIPASDQAYSMTVVSFKGEMFVTVAGRKDVAAVTDRFVELLNGNGIHAFKADGFSFRYIK